MYDHHALVGDKFAVWPVATLELRENEHALVAHFEGSGSWNLLEVWSILVLVWHEVVVKVVWKILSWDLVLHDHCMGDSIDNASSNLLEKLEVLGLVMAGVPAVFFAVLTELDNEDNVIAITIHHFEKVSMFGV